MRFGRVVDVAEVLAEGEDLLDQVERLMAYAHALSQAGASREICGAAEEMHGRLVELFDRASEARTELMSAAGLLPDAAGEG